LVSQLLNEAVGPPAGIKSIDAVHLALASAADADYFGTCDDRLLKKGRSATGLNCKVVSALDLIPKVTQ
jgi:hypothetical protein